MLGHHSDGGALAGLDSGHHTSPETRRHILDSTLRTWKRVSVTVVGRAARHIGVLILAAPDGIVWWEPVFPVPTSTFKFNN